MELKSRNYKAIPKDLRDKTLLRHEVKTWNGLRNRRLFPAEEFELK